MTRICLVTDSLEPSGVGDHMLTLGDGLRDGFDVTLACPESLGGRALLGRAARFGLGIKRLEEDGAALRQWIKRGGFTLLHVHAGIGWEGHDLALFGRAAGIPRIVRTEHLPNVMTDPGQREAHAQGVKRVDRLICVSEAVARSYRGSDIDAAKITVIRNGIDQRPARRTRDAVRSTLGLDADQPVVLMAARFTAQKDHATLIAALPAVLVHVPRLRVLLAGTGPLTDAVRAQVETLDVARAVVFLGLRDDVPDLLAACDLFVLPSRFEGLPLAVLEAMAAGLPVVAARAAGTDELVVDGVTGRLVEPGDAKGLGRAIADMLADTGKARSLAQAGQARFDAEFTAGRMADETRRLYADLGVEAETGARTIGMSDGEQARTRIGFIGAGGIAHRHLGVLRQFEDVEFVAFADVEEERAVAAAEQFGARAYTDYAAMLDEQWLDALYICVPPFAHGAPERAALARHIPFFVEKPLGLDLAAVETVARDVETSGLITAVGYHWRYLDTIDEARHLLSENPAQLLSGYWLDSTPPPAWWWKQDRSGGQVNEQTTHIVDLLRYLVGDITQVFALASHKPRPEFPGLDVATASTASLKFASGAIANIASTCLLRWNHRVGLHVFADGLAMELTDHDIMVDVGRGRPVRHAEGDPVWREDRDFIDAVRGGENRIRVPYAEALLTFRITDAISRSALSGRAIDLTPAEPAHV